MNNDQWSTYYFNSMQTGKTFQNVCIRMQRDNLGFVVIMTIIYRHIKQYFRF